MISDTVINVNTINKIRGNFVVTRTRSTVTRLRRRYAPARRDAASLIVWRADGALYRPWCHPRPPKHTLPAETSAVNSVRKITLRSENAMKSAVVAKETMARLSYRFH